MADAKTNETAKTATVGEVINKGGAAAAPQQKISEKAAVVVHVPETAVSSRIDLTKFKVAKVVTRPVLRLIDNTPVVFKIEGAMFEGKAIEGSKMAPATLMHVTDVLTGRPSQIVVPAVLEAELNENYPAQKYVGLIFGVEKLEKVEGKRYSNYNILELDAANFA